MADLEARVREKQAKKFPISKGQFFRDLAARHPHLEGDILEEREARKFTSTLSKSLASSFGSTSVPSSPVEPNHPTNVSGRSVAPVATQSPLLQANLELIFDIDDDSDGSPFVKPISREKNPRRNVNGKSSQDQPPTFQQFHIVSESHSADVNGHHTWSEVKAPGKGYILFLSPSHLTISKHVAKHVESTPKSSQASPSIPLSQSRTTSGVQSPAMLFSAPSLSAAGASPWKKQDPLSKIPFKSLQQEQINQTLSSTLPPSTQISLPERQVKPRPSPPTSHKSRLSTPSTDISPCRRSSTTPTTSPSTTPTQIRSVPGKSFLEKPTPQPPLIPYMFPVLGENLVDIIAQQSSEQKALNAKFSPRSLKEIQEEEQFLQWWEQESQRVRGEEEIVSRIMEMSLDDGEGRGTRGGRGRGRGGKGDGKGRGVGRGDLGRGHVNNRT